MTEEQRELYRQRAHEKYLENIQANRQKGRDYYWEHREEILKKAARRRKGLKVPKKKRVCKVKKVKAPRKKKPYKPVSQMTPEEHEKAKIMWNRWNRKYRETHREKYNAYWREYMRARSRRLKEQKELYNK